MPRRLATNAGSLESLKVLIRCGWSLCVHQIRRTELALMPEAAAMAAAVQWVASCGGSPPVRVTSRSIAARGKGGTREGRVWSRSSPAMPSTANRSGQCQTHGLLLPLRRMISFVPRPSAVARMIRARQTCFCGLFPVRHDRLQPDTVGGAHLDTDPLT